MSILSIASNPSANTLKALLKKWQDLHQKSMITGHQKLKKFWRNYLKLLSLPRTFWLSKDL